MTTLEQLQNSILAKTATQQFDPKELLRLEMLASLEKYTKAMFKAQYHRSFIVSDHHRQIIKALEDVVDGKIKRLMINIGPRYGKTELVVKAFISWCFALNPICKFLHLSYSDILVNDNSNTIRSAMMEPLYKELFPNSALEREKGSSTRWKTVKGGELYAVSTQGQVTGFGAGLVDDDDDDENKSAEDLTFDTLLNELLGLIGAKQNIFNGAIVIDDPLKPEDAMSDLVRERINTRFESTIRNRVNSRNTPIIIIMQRLHENDLCGYLMETEPEEWTVLSLPAIVTDENGEQKALWPMKHTLKELLKLREINPLIFDTQYMQDPKPKEGLLYPTLKTYTPEMLPQGKDAIRKWCYCDTADSGADYLCAIFFIDTPEALYVTDVLYTQKPMEFTENEMANRIVKNGTVRARIESNNGGRGFARAVKRILNVILRSYRCAVEYFAQTANKYTRIYTYSANVMCDMYFPEGWNRLWPEFYYSVTSYRKDNKRKSVHDDSCDALSGCIEMHLGRDNRKGIRRRN